MITSWVWSTLCWVASYPYKKIWRSRLPEEKSTVQNITPRLQNTLTFSTTSIWLEFWKMTYDHHCAQKTTVTTTLPTQCNSFSVLMTYLTTIVTTKGWCPFTNPMCQFHLWRAQQSFLHRRTSSLKPSLHACSALASHPLCDRYCGRVHGYSPMIYGQTNGHEARHWIMSRQHFTRQICCALLIFLFWEERKPVIQPP